MENVAIQSLIMNPEREREREKIWKRNKDYCKLASPTDTLTFKCIRSTFKCGNID